MKKFAALLLTLCMVLSLVACGGGEKKEEAPKAEDPKTEAPADEVKFDGVIKEVTDGAILLEKDGKEEAINLDFVIRIREYPRNKNGKKKSVVLD